MVEEEGVEVEAGDEESHGYGCDASIDAISCIMQLQGSICKKETCVEALAARSLVEVLVEVP